MAKLPCQKLIKEDFKIRTRVFSRDLLKKEDGRDLSHYHPLVIFENSFATIEIDIKASFIIVSTLIFLFVEHLHLEIQP